MVANSNMILCQLKLMYMYTAGVHTTHGTMLVSDTEGPVVIRVIPHLFGIVMRLYSSGR